MGVTAFIPAKMKSNRLPGKNMRQLCGRPLIYYSIRAAQMADGVTDVVVSSEDQGVLEYAESQGATAVRRDEALASDPAQTLDVTRDWYLKLSGAKPEIIALLQPTHPMRDPKELSKAIEVMRSDPSADSMMTIIPMTDLIGELSGGVFQPDVPLPRNRALEPRRFKNTGSFYLLRPERTLISKASFGQRILGHELARPDREVDIDYPHDLAFAEEIFKWHPEILEMYR